MAAKRQGGSGRKKALRKGGQRTDGPSQAQPAKKRSRPSDLPPQTGQGDDASCATDPAPPAEAAGDRFPVVGIGASAGGLEALQEFFGNMPAGTGIGFVVVTHQHPGRVSLLPALLARSTSMPVVEATDGVRVEPNHVYVALPGGLLQIAEGVLHRRDADSATAPHLPIDHFFRSLAGDLRERAICVVLSGTGTDGTLGMRAVKAEAGMAMVQEAQSAKYAGMPASAGATGLADYVLPAAKMPVPLIAYTKGPYLNLRLPKAEARSFPKEPLEQILASLRAQTGHDFTCYKANTVRRRIERRMTVHQIEDPAAYVHYLQENPPEIDRLFAELLISVTSFFRDPQAFDVLAEKALPELLASRAQGHEFRVWVPGCASGEEAYSIAILFHECMQKLKGRFNVQVFGTDLDAHAIEAARAGVYPAGIAADISKERLERYFAPAGNAYHVCKEIREALVFASQNVIKDPPFTKLDLVVCRNLLIYLDAELQRRLLPIFHYALRPGGLLFLGPSESIGGFGELFETIDSKWKLFCRKDAATPVHPSMELPTGLLKTGAAELTPAAPAAHIQEKQILAMVDRLLLARFAPTSLVVDERGTIIYIHGRTGAYLEPTERQPRHNILEMARRGLGRPLATAMRQAAAENREVVREKVRVKTNGEFIHVNLSVTRIEEPQAIRGLLLVSLLPADAPLPRTAAKPQRDLEEQPGSLAELEHELQYVKESQQTTVEELETSNEELKSTNEELQSTNEELQSTNEELETSKEEMQSLNEELGTINTELQAKVEELSQATDDMQNLLNNIQVATIFLDDQLNVKRYTAEAQKLFKLIPTDVGRPLSDLTSNVDYDRLIDDCQEVLRTLASREAEVCDRDGSWYLMRILPYRTAAKVINGVVITFVDINRLKQAEKGLKTAKDTLERRITERIEAIRMLDEIASMANHAQNTEQAMEYCLRRIMTYNGWCFGHALLPAADNADELVPAHAWYTEDPERFRRFREVTFGLRLRRGQGLPGRVFASGKPEWTTDLRGDLMPRRALLAEELGIGMAIAFPVLTGEKVVAVLEFFSDHDNQPNEYITDALAGVGVQLGRAIERAEFAEHLLTTAEEIQRRIAQDLHDDVGQELAGLGLTAETLAETVASSEMPAGKLVASIVAAVDRMHDKVRGLARGMSPMELEEGMLAGALKQLAATTSEISHIGCNFTGAHPDPVFNNRVSVHLYRIAQAAVANAVRHSGAHNIRITLDGKDGKTVLSIEDDGTGISREAAQTEGMGLRTMRYRAGLIGGKLEVGPGPGGGTQVVCRMASPPPPPKTRNSKSNWRQNGWLPKS
jgi:two-component system CheB/CheR fusion protein